MKSETLANRLTVACRRAAVLLGALALTGCVAVWGSSYSIESQNSDGITIQYDGNFTTPDRMDKIAAANCDAYGRKAVRAGEKTSLWNITTATYRCTPR